MDKIDELLMYVQKTNPGMTREKLIDELNHFSITKDAPLFGIPFDVFGGSGFHPFVPRFNVRAFCVVFFCL